MEYIHKSQTLNRIPFSFVPAKAIRGLHRYGFPVLGERLYHNSKNLDKCEKGPPFFLIRVDDFPRWDLDSTHFRRFHDILQNYNVPYVLGVTPFLQFNIESRREMNDKEVALLQGISAAGVALALHGFTHLNRVAPYGQPCETYFYSEREIKSLMERAKQWFLDRLLPKPIQYIPPFNTFSFRDYEILTREYKIFHGGPLSLSTFGKFAQSIKKGVFYVPSYEPFYNRAEKIIKILTEHRGKFRHRLLYPLTLHWAWEYESNYKNVIILLRILSERNWLLGPDSFRNGSYPLIGGQSGTFCDGYDL